MTPQPRKKYAFDKMRIDDVKKIDIPDSDPQAGARALRAAYAYGLRNNQEFCGATQTYRGRTVSVAKKRMLIRRVK